MTGLDSVTRNGWFAIFIFFLFSSKSILSFWLNFVICSFSLEIFLLIYSEYPLKFLYFNFSFFSQPYFTYRFTFTRFRSGFSAISFLKPAGPSFFTVPSIHFYFLHLMCVLLSGKQKSLFFGAFKRSKLQID